MVRLEFANCHAWPFKIKLLSCALVACLSLSLWFALHGRLLLQTLSGQHQHAHVLATKIQTQQHAYQQFIQQQKARIPLQAAGLNKSMQAQSALFSRLHRLAEKNGLNLTALNFTPKKRQHQRMIVMTLEGRYHALLSFLSTTTHLAPPLLLTDYQFRKTQNALIFKGYFKPMSTQT